MLLRKSYPQNLRTGNKEMLLRIRKNGVSTTNWTQMISVSVQRRSHQRGNKMKKAEMKPYKEMLLSLRSRLRGDVTTMADVALNKTRSESNGDLSSMPIHMADIGSDNYEQEFTLSMMESEESTLEAVEAALERIEDRSYGACEDCGKAIRKTRLKAIPYTPLCIQCASKR